MILQYIKNVSPWEYAVATYKFTYATNNKFICPGDFEGQHTCNPRRVWERCQPSSANCKLEQCTLQPFPKLFCSSYTVYYFELDGLKSKHIFEGSYSMVCKKHCGQITKLKL